MLKKVYSSTSSCMIHHLFSQSHLHLKIPFDNFATKLYRLIFNIMEKIASFTIDHTRLEPGIFVSRRDRTPSGDVVTTFDIRMTRPNREPSLEPRALHAMEHLAATFLRNSPEWKDKVVYWGPMGCCTGNYLLLAGEYESADILPLMRLTMEFIAGFTGDIPGASPRDCGNWTFMDLEGARRAARRYLDETLASPRHENLNYPE